MANQSVTYDAADHLADWDALICRFVSDRLQAQTINVQTIALQMQAQEAVGTNNLFIAWQLLLVDGSGIPVAGGSIVNARRDTFEVVRLVNTNRGESVTSLGPVTCPVNSRLVLEIGLGGLPTVSASVDGHNGALRIGDAGASDLPVDDTTTNDTAFKPWLEFAQTLLFVPVVTPAIRVSQDSLEVLYDEPVAVRGGVRVSQDSIEALWSDAINGDARVTQDSLEVLYAGTVQLNVTQDSLEALYGEEVISIPRVRVTQDSLELLWDVDPPEDAEDVTTYPDGDITTACMVAGWIQSGGMVEGDITTAHMAKGQVLL